MDKLVGMCSKFMDVVASKLCFRNGDNEGKKKPTINVTQAIQMNQQEQDDTKEKQLPATKPHEILKREIESLLKQLQVQEKNIDYFIRNFEKKFGYEDDLNAYNEFIGEIHKFINKAEEKDIEDEDDKENLIEFKNSEFYKNLQKFVQERKKLKKKKDELKIDGIYLEQKGLKNDGFFQEIMQRLNNQAQIDKRQFNSNILKEDPQIKDILSFTTLSIINNKQCQPESYESSQAQDMLIQDATEWVKDIELIYIISSKGDQHIYQENNLSHQQQTQFFETLQKVKEQGKSKNTPQDHSIQDISVQNNIISLQHLENNTGLPTSQQLQEEKVEKELEQFQNDEFSNSQLDDFQMDDEQNEGEDQDNDYEDLDDRQEAQNKLLEVIQNALANIDQQKKQLNKMQEKTGIIRRTVWFAKNKRFVASKLQVEINWIDGTIADVANYFEQEFKLQKKIREKYQMMQSQYVLKVIHTAFYQQQIFFGSLLYITVEIKETGEHCLRDLIKKRQEQDNNYKDVEVAYIIQIINNALQEAKKLNVYHSNINDGNIYFFPDLKTYKLGDFMFYDFDKDFRKIGNTPQSRNRISEKVDQNSLIFHAPEILKLYKKNIQNYNKQKEEADNFSRDIKKRQLEFLKSLNKQLDNQGHFNLHQNLPKTINNFDEVYSVLEESKDYLTPAQQSQMRKLIAEKYDEIRKDLESGSVDVFKADIYSLGMVAIKMIIKGKLESIYNNPKKTPKEKFIQIFRIIQKQKQFIKLIPLLKRMIAFNPDKRFTHQEIEGFIQKLKKPPSKPTDDLFYQIQTQSNEQQFLTQFQEKQSQDKQSQDKQKEVIYNLYKVAQGYYDLRSYQKAGKIYKELLNHHEILTENLQLDRILQIQFQLALTYYERRKLANAKIVFFDQLQLAKEYIEKNQLDIRFYRPYYYLAGISFMEEQYDSALKYIEKLQSLTESYLNQYYFWSKCMLQILEANILGDMNNNLLAIRKLKQVYNQAGQWCLQNNFNQELYIDIIYCLGIQYLQSGNYKQSELAFKQTIRCIKERNNPFLSQNVILMSMGYLGVIGFEMNELKLLSNYTQKCYDKILVYQRSEGDYVDTILKWLNKFGQFLPVLLVNSEIKQLIDILQIGLSKVQKNLYHNEIQIYYIMAKAHYYAGDFNGSINKFLDALQAYNESSKVLLDYKSKGQGSTYKTRQQIIFNKIENEKIRKQKLLDMERDKFKFRFYHFQIPQFNLHLVDKALIANIYDWLCYLYFYQNKLPQSKECFLNYQQIMNQVQTQNEQVQIRFSLRMGKIFFLYQNYEMSLQALAKSLGQLDSIPKFQLSYTTRQLYSEIVNLSGLIALILQIDDIGFKRFEEGLNQFENQEFNNLEKSSPLKSPKSNLVQSKQFSESSPRTPGSKKIEMIKVKDQEEVTKADLIESLQEQEEEEAVPDIFKDDEEEEEESEESQQNLNQNQQNENLEEIEEADAQPKEKDIEKNYRYNLELDEYEKDELNLNKLSQQHFLINNYIDITLNCIYIGLYEKALQYIQEGYNKIFGGQTTKKKKKANQISQIDFRFILGYVNALNKNEWNSLYHFYECMNICQSIYEKNVVNKTQKQRYAIICTYVANQFCKLGVYKEAFVFQDNTLKIIQKDVEVVQAQLASVCTQLNKLKQADIAISKAKKAKYANPQDQLIVDCKYAEVRLKYDQEEAIKIYQEVMVSITDPENFQAISYNTKAFILKSIAKFVLEVDDQLINIQKIYVFSQCLNYSFKFYTICDNQEAMVECLVMFAEMYFNTCLYEKCLNFIEQLYNQQSFKIIRQRVTKMKQNPGIYENLQNYSDSILFSQNMIYQADIIRLFAKCHYHLNTEYRREFEAIREQLILCKDIYEICLQSNNEIQHFKINDTLMYLFAVELQNNEFTHDSLKNMENELQKIDSFLKQNIKSFWFNAEDITFLDMVRARCKLGYSSFFRSYSLYQKFMNHKLNSIGLNYNPELKRKLKNLVENEKQPDYLDFFSQYFVLVDKRKTTIEQQKEFISVLFGDPNHTQQFKHKANELQKIIGSNQGGFINLVKNQVSQIDSSQTLKQESMTQINDKYLIDNQKEYVQEAERIIWDRIQKMTQDNHPFKKEIQMLYSLIGKYRDQFRD
ncbi:hypothetical protein TTHERM_00298400 (macronuclear) [Tetrahymena thermophila SB210]|uniref:Protein kinase domain-containing protein n=1 Tax=Tetrahymena thermophila (strain SB210) TaxID=312017 RepID=I7LX99_TETTS|nr:hypothetical protein TTHERM_00298400 [Tetrahymena thermophila SB210]EAS04229.2 hypothetical protein TTHERM_00298400 [Tetrahymena thermophila SB210]|eukprot:XP_001024474.2 hypothetical protein TTHERM_00298400 [Tetrahymena thermophila SB210]